MSPTCYTIRFATLTPPYNTTRERIFFLSLAFSAIQIPDDILARTSHSQKTHQTVHPGTRTETRCLTLSVYALTRICSVAYITRVESVV